MYDPQGDNESIQLLSGFIECLISSYKRLSFKAGKNPTKDVPSLLASSRLEPSKPRLWYLNKMPRPPSAMWITAIC